MKLYEVPRNTNIRILDPETTIPICSTSLEENKLLHFHHIDGMYSYCTTFEGEVVHPAAWTEVEIIK